MREAGGVAVEGLAHLTAITLRKELLLGNCLRFPSSHFSDLGEFRLEVVARTLRAIVVIFPLIEKGFQIHGIKGLGYMAVAHGSLRIAVHKLKS